MRVIPPLTITNSILTSSSVPELAPATLYLGGVTYALGDQVSVSGANNLRSVYKSLVGSNLGHTPATSPTWWEYLGDTYGEYAVGTTYALGASVNDVATHKIYESITAGNVGNALTDVTKWLEIGYNNRWSMFDYQHGGKSETPGTQTIVLTPGVRVDSISLINIVATSVQVSVSIPGYTSGIYTRVVNSWYTYLFAPFIGGTEEAYTNTIDLIVHPATDMYSYFHNPFWNKGRIGIFDLPPVTNSIITVTLTNTDGPVSLGNLVLVFGIYIGGVQYGVDNDALNFSTIDRSFDGGLNSVVQRRNITKINGQAMIPASLVSTAKKIRDDLNAVPAIWAGIEDITQDYYESLFILGIIRKFSINAAFIDDAIINFEIEEI